MTMNFSVRRSFSKPLMLVLLGTSLVFSGGQSNVVFAEENPAVAKVGDRVITKADLDQAMKDMGEQFQGFPEAERRARALDSMIDINVLAIAAEKAGLDKDPEIMRRIQLLTARALHNGYFQTKIQPAITDETLKARFDKEIAETKPEQEVSARHILVKTEDEAKAIIKELDGGADFIELAKTKSTGPSGPKGGDLGFFGKGRMVPEFEAAAYALEKGKYTKVAIKTQFGFHIIKVDDKRDRPLPTFDASKEQLRQVMLTEAYAKAVVAGRSEVGVSVLDESLKLPEVKK